MNKLILRLGLMALFCIAALAGARDAKSWPSDILTINAGGQGRAALAKAWGLNPAEANNLFSQNGVLRAVLIKSSVPANVLWPKDQARMTFQFRNLTDAPVVSTGKLLTIQYELYTPTSANTDVFDVHIRKIADAGSVPIAVNIPAHGIENVVVKPFVPERFGGYALIIALNGMDRLFGAGCVRSIKPDDAPLRFPRLALDCPAIDLNQRLGTAPNRIGIPYKPSTDPDFDTWMAGVDKQLDAYKAARMPVMIEFGVNNGAQPGGCARRTYLDADNRMTASGNDMTWLPSQDPDFEQYVRRIAVEYGWPKGPVTAMKFMNEPWNGGGISGWGADDERYREIFTALCRGVADARREAGVDIYTGGTDSSADTLDKLFSDGKETYLPDLDFMSIHYQGMSPATTVKMFNSRTGPHGKVHVWDTESWEANSEERVAAFDAACYAMGEEHVVGTESDQVALSERNVQVIDQDGQTETRRVPHAWSVAPALAASERFMGNRTFRRILFKKGLPWVFVFNGLPNKSGVPDPEDGTVVVVGDLGPIFGDDSLLFRGVRSDAEVAHKLLLKRKLAALPSSAPADQRRKLLNAIATSEPITGAAMTVAVPDDAFSLYDYYGNKVPARGGKIVIPLDSRGFYLQGNGKPGSFAKLLRALRTARIEGYEPLECVCRDMTSPIEQGASVRMSLTNILNRPVAGKLKVTLGNLATAYPRRLSFAPYETKDIQVKVLGGAAAADNSYPLSMIFDAGKDGTAVHDEVMHVNYIAKRTIPIDGNLSDWNGVIPQIISVDEAARPTRMEAAWKPWIAFDRSVRAGNAQAFLAYDDHYFYFLAKIADAASEPGTIRFATRDDNSYFYPDHWTGTDDGGKTIAYSWPAGVRHYSYRREPDLPGDADGDVQIAFNVLPEDKKPWSLSPPGTMPRFTSYWDTDYEYALDQVAPQYGGGTEIWRLLVPGMPRKHFYPRDPKSPFDGPVKDGKLVITHDGTTRYVECAIPWSEIPAVKRAKDAGETVKFDYRVTVAGGNECMELAKGRSVSKRNPITFHPDWQEHWANELEFGFQK